MSDEQKLPNEILSLMLSQMDDESAKNMSQVNKHLNSEVEKRKQKFFDKISMLSGTKLHTNKPIYDFGIIINNPKLAIPKDWSFFEHLHELDIVFYVPEVIPKLPESLRVLKLTTLLNRHSKITSIHNLPSNLKYLSLSNFKNCEEITVPPYLETIEFFNMDSPTLLTPNHQTLFLNITTDGEEDVIYFR